MKRGLAALAMVATLLLVPLGSADYLMGGVDGQRTGNSQEAAPAWGDVAYQISLPGISAYLSGPLIIGGQAFVLAPSYEAEEESGLWRIDLDSGDAGDGPIVPLIRIDDLLDNPGYVSDGERILMVRTGAVEMYNLDGDVLNRVELPAVQPSLPGSRLPWGCFNPVWEGNMAYFPCNEFHQREQPDGEAALVGEVSFIVAIDTDSFTVDVWLMESAFHAAQSSSFPRPDVPADRTCNSLPEGGICPQTLTEVIYGVTVGGDQLTATIAVGGHYSEIDPTNEAVPQGTAYTDQRIFSLDKMTGDVIWAHHLNTDTEANQGDTLPAIPSPLHLYHDNVVSFIFKDLFHLNSADGSVASPTNSLDTRDPDGRDFGGVLATDGTQYFAASHQRVRSYDDRWGLLVDRGLPSPDGNIGLAPVLVADGIVFVQSDQGSQTAIGTTAVGTVGRVLANLTSVNAFDATTLDPLWTVTAPVSMSLPLSGSSFAISDGLIVQVTRSGLVTVIGETSASLVARPDVSSAYPKSGSTVEVDLSASSAGSLGQPPTKYKVDWGDGQIDDWGPSPILSHVYEEGADYVARFYVGNNAEQTASTTMTFYVDGTPRNRAAQWIEGNPDAAWGIFGLIIVLVGAAITSARLAKRRGLMGKELAAIDAAAEAAGASSTKLRAAMDDRRARAHGLLLDHRVDESQYQVLIGRIENMVSGGRRAEMAALLDILPHGLVKALDDMLADGRVTSIERAGFTKLLSENSLLNPAQRRKAQGFIDRWFEEDRA